MEAARGPQEPAADRKRGGTYSGRLLLRMSEALHADLARASERAGTSLNGYINGILADAVGRGPAAPRRPAAGEPVRSGRRQFAERLLVANLVVLAAVGALVVVLLVQAIR
jgi:hypothetical protein